MREVVIKYRPQSYQLDWHNNPTRFLVAVTGRQVGKTTAAVNELIMRALSKPNQRVWYVTNDYKQAKRNVWDEFKKFIPEEAYPKYNESELKITFPNGSKIELIGVENAETLRGAAVHFMILDEYADFSREVWPKVLSKMFTATNGDAWFIGTPKGLGNDFYDKFHAEDPLITAYELPACTIKEGVVTECASKFASKEVIQHALDTEPWDIFRQEYLADFTKPEGTVYDEWNLTHFKRVPYDANLPVHLAFDFGVNDPTAIIWIQPMGGEYRVIDYYEKKDASVDHFVQYIRSRPYKQPEMCVGDPAGAGRSMTTNTSPIDEYAKGGIFIRTKTGVRLEEQIAMTHKIIPSLFVDRTLTRFRDCLLNYRYPTDDEKKSKINRSKEVPVHDEFSHGMRALEYYATNVSDFGGAPPVIIGETEGLGGVMLPKYRF
jgi:phage terminase large subunit